MSDIKKFLDQGGVSTLWSRVAEEIKKVDNKAAQNASDITELKGKVSALEAGTYDDTAVKALIATNAEGIAANKAAHEANAAAIGVLNGDGEGSVSKIATTIAATKVAEIVAGANADFDTLKEIADWILNDTTGAADMANKIAALTGLVGDKSVATQIADAIAAENLAQYAKAADLETTNGNVTALTNKVDTGDKTVSAYVSAAIDAIKIGDYAKAADLTLLAGRVTTLEGKVADLEAADIAMDARVVAMEGKVAKWDAAEANAKAYADSEITRRVIALTTAEIDAAIANASAQV